MTKDVGRSGSGTGSARAGGADAAGAAEARRWDRGQAGEDLAAAWYETHGYQLLARNWCRREGELDIVARLGSMHVFCEVKARSSARFGLPAEAVGPLKQARLRRLAALWFAAQSVPPSGRGRGGPVRFDVACVLDGSIEVIEAAF